MGLLGGTLDWLGRRTRRSCRFGSEILTRGFVVATRVACRRGRLHTPRTGVPMPPHTPSRCCRDTVLGSHRPVPHVSTGRDVALQTFIPKKYMRMYKRTHKHTYILIYIHTYMCGRAGVMGCVRHHARGMDATEERPRDRRWQNGERSDGELCIMRDRFRTCRGGFRGIGRWPCGP